MTNSIPLKIFVYNAGFGQAVALRLPSGKIGIIDWGATGLVQQLIDDVGDDAEIEFVVITHPHEDHTLGLVELFRAFTDDSNRHCRIRWLAAPIPFSTQNSDLRAVYKMIDHQETAGWPDTSRTRIVDLSLGIGDKPKKIYPIDISDPSNLEGILLAPSSKDTSPSGLDSFFRQVNPGNPVSAVLLFRFRNNIGQALFCGDTESRQWKGIHALVKAETSLELKNQFCILPHHGSKYGADKKLLNSIQNIAAISSSGSQKGLPSKGILKVLSGRQHIADPRSTSITIRCTNYGLACRDAFNFVRDLPTPPPIARTCPCCDDMTFLLFPDGTGKMAHGNSGFGHCGWCGI